MSFNFSGNNRNSDDSWKSQAFINLSLPTENGQAKVGTIFLKEADEQQAELIKMLKRDPSLLQAVKDALILDFQLADKEKPRFVLPIKASA